MKQIRFEIGDTAHYIRGDKKICKGFVTYCRWHNKPHEVILLSLNSDADGCSICAYLKEVFNIRLVLTEKTCKNFK